MMLRFVTNVTNFILFYLFLQVLIIYFVLSLSSNCVYAFVFFSCVKYIYIIYIADAYIAAYVFHFVYVYINMYAWIFILQSYILTDNLGQMMWLNVVCFCAWFSAFSFVFNIIAKFYNKRCICISMYMYISSIYYNSMCIFKM